MKNKLIVVIGLLFLVSTINAMQPAPVPQNQEERGFATLSFDLRRTLLPYLVGTGNSLNDAIQKITSALLANSALLEGLTIKDIPQILQSLEDQWNVQIFVAARNFSILLMKQHGEELPAIKLERKFTEWLQNYFSFVQAIKMQRAEDLPLLMKNGMFTSNIICSIIQILFPEHGYIDLQPEIERDIPWLSSAVAGLPNAQEYQRVLDKFVRENDLRRAIEQEDRKKIEELLQAGVDINGRFCSGGLTPLDVAVGMGKGDIIRYLVSKGANINQINVQGTTPLIQAFRQRRATPALIRTLLDLKADVNRPDREGNTPLMHAIWSDVAAEIVTMLIEAGANVNARSANGLTALYYAQQQAFAQHVYTEVVEILRAAGATK